MAEGAEKSNIDLAEGALANARQARLDFCVFRKDVGVPGEVSALARMVWLEIPEMARRMGAKIESIEDSRSGFAVEPLLRAKSDAAMLEVANASDKGLLEMIGRSAKEAAPLADWLAPIHSMSKDVVSMFKPGEENSLSGAMDAFARDGGFRRSDALAPRREPHVASFVRARSQGQEF